MKSKVIRFSQAALLMSFGNEKEKPKMQKIPITLIKNINQSLSPTDIQENVKNFKKFKAYFHTFKSIISHLNLSDQATEYFASWVQKSTVFQLNQFQNKNKVYLYLLCYIKHQFYYRNDILVDIFLKSVTSMVNVANAQLNTFENKNRSARNKAIKKVTVSSKGSRAVIESITEIIKSPTLLETEKLSRIETIIDQYHIQHNSAEKQSIIQAEQSLDDIGKNKTFFDALENVSLRLQNRVSEITKVLEFNTVTSTKNLITAINYFSKSNGDIGNSPPMGFLNKNETERNGTENKGDIKGLS